MSVIDTLNTERLQAHHQAKEILDRCVEDGKRARTAEEEEMFARANSDYDRLSALIVEYQDTENREREANVARAALESVVRPEVQNAREVADTNAVMAFLRGDTSTLEIDLGPAARQSQLIRAGLTGPELYAAAVQTDGGASGGSLTVPTTIASQVYAFMVASSAVRRISRVIQTGNGETMKFPKVVTHSVGTQIADEDTTIGGSDPVLGELSLTAFDYGELMYVSANMVNDSAVDVVSFVGEQIGRALGIITDTAYVTGGGTTAPTGVVTALTGSIATGGSLIEATFEKLIDLKYSIADTYHDSASWLVKGSTAASLRKIRSGAGGTEGDFIWSPSVIPGTPDTILGNPVYLDGNVAAQGSAAKTVLYGDFSAYYIRDAGPLELARSNEIGFAKNQVAFRGILRTDAGLIDAAAIKYLHQRT